MGLFLVIWMLTFLWSAPEYDELTFVEGKVTETYRKKVHRDGTYRVIHLETSSYIRTFRVPIIGSFRKVKVGDLVSAKVRQHFLRTDIFTAWELSIDGELEASFGEFVVAEIEKLKRLRWIILFIALVALPIFAYVVRNKRQYWKM